jgi:hypothetical protein
VLQLTGTSDLIRVVTGAAADIEVHASWVENNAGTITPGRTNTASIVTATTTTVVGSPASGVQRRVTALSLRNNHGSQACDVTVTHEDGTNTVSLIKVPLLAGETLEMDSRGEWHHLDVNGAEYHPAVAVATQAEMEAGSSLIVGVTPGRQHFHPGHPKVWCAVRLVQSGPFIVGAYNITSITDGGAGLTTFTIATDFSDTSYAISATVERPSTSLSATNVKYSNIRNATQAAGSFLIEVYDGTATTHVQEDAYSWYAMALGDQ